MLLRENAILETKCSKLHTNLVDLMHKNTVKVLK